MRWSYGRFFCLKCLSVRLQPIADHLCGGSGGGFLHGVSHGRKERFVVRKRKGQVCDFFRGVRCDSHACAEKIVEVVLLAARDGVNYAAKRRSQKSGV